jgi:cellulose synthase/poly-beta-1,6-N-acetylglucosamine synthase-like glycosyltransferase
VDLPYVTVVIAAPPGMNDIRAVAGAKALDYPPDQLEIIVARGRQPSVQRNSALRAARGEIIYFLDDDSVPFSKDTLLRAVEHFRSPDVKMVGGPNLCPPEAPALQHAFSITMGTKLAFGPSAARYRSIGKTRESSEKELILCNLLARRDPVIELGGFNEKLYPNEENALMDELQKRGGKLIYDPDLIVHRHPRPTLKAFCKMLMNYGRGRAEQFRLHPTINSAANFVPPAFVLYLLAVPFLAWRFPFSVFHFPFSIFVLPLFAYAAAVLVQALAAVGKQIHWLPGISLLIFLSHILYGLGFWHGCFTKPKPPTHSTAAEIKLERM